ncbi:MAG: 1-deoxy-D-xylulose-5-phosphate synthase [Hyphomicrobiaceae bacterium]
MPTRPSHRANAPFLPIIDNPETLRTLPRSALPQVADELREELLAIVAETGGHLGAGLGVVELTVALHYVYDTPRDRLIWDVSHQCYPHKILTGRREAMRALRQKGGPAGFTSRNESPYDPFGTAHSSTSLSAGLGFAVARDLNATEEHVVAVIGDGALTGGLAMEGLNNIGAEQRRLVIVLNDNNMSIAPPSGAVAQHLAILRRQMPDKDARQEAFARDPLPRFVSGSTIFDAFGLTYCGPFDGHDVDEMVRVLEAARRHPTGPVVVHVRTDKGHGYAPALKASDRYHSVSPFDIASGQQRKSASRARSYTSVFSEALIAEAHRDERVVAITAAMPSGTGLDTFGKVFPNRCFDAGIAEQHAVTFAAALAADGMRPFAAIYSTFLQRAYDQIVHDVAIQRLPVRFAIDRAGLVGQDGMTHQGAFDIAMLGCLPHFVLMAAGDEAELARMVATACEIDDRPCAFRFPRGDGIGVPVALPAEPIEIGRGRVIVQGDDACILSYGSRLPAALEAARALEGLGVSVTVADARFAKPIDDDLVARLAREHTVLITLEEGSVGGFATQVVDSLMRQRLEQLLARVRSLHLPDEFIDHDSPASQVARAGLDAESIAARVMAEVAPVNGRWHLRELRERVNA